MSKDQQNYSEIKLLFRRCMHLRKAVTQQMDATDAFDQYKNLVLDSLDKFPDDGGLWLLLGWGYHFFSTDESRRFELAEDAYVKALEVEDSYRIRAQAIPLITHLYWQVAKQSKNESHEADFLDSRAFWQKRTPGWGQEFSFFGIFDRWWDVNFAEMFVDVTPAEELWNVFYGYGVDLLLEDPRLSFVATRRALDLYQNPPSNEQNASVTVGIIIHLLLAHTAYLDEIIDRYDSMVTNMGVTDSVFFGDGITVTAGPDTVTFHIDGEKIQTNRGTYWYQAFNLVSPNEQLSLLHQIVGLVQKFREVEEPYEGAFEKCLCALLRQSPFLQKEHLTLETISKSFEQQLCDAGQIDGAWLNYYAGRIYLHSLGMNAEALSYLELAWQVLGDEPEILEAIALAYARNGKINQAERVIERMVRRTANGNLILDLVRAIQIYTPNFEFMVKIEDLIAQQQIAFSQIVDMRNDITEQLATLDTSVESLGQQIIEHLDPDIDLIESVTKRCEYDFAIRWNLFPKQLQQEIISCEVAYEQLSSEPLDNYRLLIFAYCSLAEMALKLSFLIPLGEYLKEQIFSRPLFFRSLNTSFHERSIRCQPHDWPQELSNKTLPVAVGLLLSAKEKRKEHPVYEFLHKQNLNSAIWLFKLPELLTELCRYRNDTAHPPSQRNILAEAVYVRSLLRTQGLLAEVAIACRGQDSI